MPKIIVDGQTIEVGAQERLNGIQAAQRAGVEIPHYCWHAGLTVVASCRMCLVENGKLDPATGKIAMQPKLVPACQTPATDGSVFVTNSDKVKQARAMVEEDLLIRHPVDCPICDKAGECSLQDYHFEHGQAQRRADIRPFTSRRRPVGPTVTLFVDRCVMCTRCVRFTREIAGTSELMVANRGAHEEIDTVPGFPLANKLSGNVVDLCPVGALGDVDFLYQQRVWFMKKHDGVCSGCSTGCSITVEENQDQVYRLKPRENQHINKWWMCDEGRYGFHHVHDNHRLTELARREGSKITPLDWAAFVPEITAKLEKAGQLAVVLSPFLTVELAWLIGSWIRKLDPRALVAVGPIPKVGEDESFPGGFTIHAEKCPNRRGVELVAARLNNGLLSWEEFLQRTETDPPQALWVAGGYREPWIDEAAAEKLAAIPLLVVQDLFPSPLSERATYVVPATAFAEKEGSYVNFNDRLQSFGWAIRPPSGLMTEGHLYWRLAGRSGMFRARPVMEEIAREVSVFAPAAQPVPEVGVDLKGPMLAGGNGAPAPAAAASV